MSGILRSTATILAGAVLALAPTAHAAPQQCDETFGESVDGYLKRHPDVQRTLAERGHREDPGAPNPVLAYLERHPDVRAALITLSQQCV